MLFNAQSVGKDLLFKAQPPKYEEKACAGIKKGLAKYDRRDACAGIREGQLEKNAPTKGKGL